MNELDPDGGSFSVGETVKIGYVDQTHKDIHPDSVYDVVSNGLEYVGVGKQKINSRAYYRNSTLPVQIRTRKLACYPAVSEIDCI